MWFVDFEYSREDDREPPFIVCMTAREAGSGHEIRMFREELLTRPAAPFPTGEHACIVAYSAGAEGSSFAALGWPDPVNVLDPYAEHLRDRNGRQDRYEHDTRLLEAMKQHGLPALAYEDKEAMRDMARFQTSWTAEERVALLDYCMGDNLGTLALVRAMEGKGLINWPQALWRGRFMFLTGSHIEHRPLLVDVEGYRELNAAFPSLRRALLDSVAHFGVFEKGHLREALLNELIKDAGLSPQWPRTSAQDYARCGEPSCFEPSSRQSNSPSAATTATGFGPGPCCQRRDAISLPPTRTYSRRRSGGAVYCRRPKAMRW
jgi:hypothetical protein